TCVTLGDTRFIGYCAVFKVREEVTPGGLPGAVSQNSTACGPLGRDTGSRRAACEARSTLLEPIALEEVRHGAQELRRHWITRAWRFLPAIGALWLKGSLERR